MPKVSVIIPCYNMGKYIEETVNSVLNSSSRDFEVIIVDDGSTDNPTLNLLDAFSNEKVRVFHTSNQGLASARNYGIEESSSEYILPLDADDKISSSYISEAVKILDDHPEVGVVYCNSRFFGAKRGKWVLPAYSLENILAANVIHCSALFRKADWKKVGGYKPEMRYGAEDWEFWLSLIELGVQVYKLPGYHFFYRIRNDSMARTTNIIKEDKIFEQIYQFHQPLYDANLPNPLKLYHELKKYKHLYGRVDMRIYRKIISPLIFIFNKLGIRFH